MENNQNTLNEYKIFSYSEAKGIFATLEAMKDSLEYINTNLLKIDGLLTKEILLANMKRGAIK